MRIRWKRVFGLILLCLFIYLLSNLKPYIGNFFDRANQDSVFYEDPVMIGMLGLLCLTFIGAIKLMFTRN